MYVRCIDGLRAIAILLVLFSHSVHSGIPEFLSKIIQFWNAGTVGVRLFFLISGFLITTILKNELKKNGKINFKNFFIRRFLRIFPAFYFYLLILFILSFFNLIVIGPSAIFFAMFYIQNLNVFQNTELFPTSWLVKHSWSLSVEEQFYLIYPFIVNPTLNFFKRKLINKIILMTTIFTFFRILNYSYPDISRITGGVFFMHCDFLIYGGLLSTINENDKKFLIRKISPYKYLILLISFIVLIYASKYEYNSVINIAINGNLILISSLYVLTFFVLFPNSKLGNLMENKMLKSVGKLSYGLYIWQQLFMGSTDLWNNFKILTFFPYNIIVIFICAIISFYLIEKPFLKLKNKYS
jgi:peptidoglycan/LPS O-acetylase OafA/YrhL